MYFVRSISFAVFRLRECVFECRVFVCVVVGRLVFRSFRLDGGCGEINLTATQMRRPWRMAPRRDLRD
jgi:hypothetical protein